MADNIKQIQTAAGAHELEAKYMQSKNVGSVGTAATNDVSKPVYFDANGQPQPCAFSVNYGALANRPASGTEGDVYFVI